MIYMSDLSEALPVAAKKARKPLTDKQKTARIANLAKGRQTRMENLQKARQKSVEEYVDDEKSESEDDEDEEIVVSTRKVAKRTIMQKSKPIDIPQVQENKYATKDEMRDLLKVMNDMRKKNNKVERKVSRTPTALATAPPVSKPAVQAETKPVYSESAMALAKMLGKC